MKMEAIGAEIRSEKPDPRENLVSAADWVAQHYLHNDVRRVNLTAVLKLLADKDEAKLTIPEVQARLGVPYRVAAYILNSALELSQQYSAELPILVSARPIPVKKQTVARLEFTARLNPAANLHDGDLNVEVSDGKMLPVKSNTRRLAAIILSDTSFDVDLDDITETHPRILDGIICNASWAFREERRDMQCIRDLFAARQKGLAVNITFLQKRRGVVTARKSSYGHILEKASFSHAFETRIVVLQDPALPKGYYTVELVTEECQSRAVRKNVVPYAAPFLSDVHAIPFDFATFKDKLKALSCNHDFTTERARDELQIRLMHFVAERQRNGIYPSTEATREVFDISRSGLEGRISLSQKVRHAAKVYLRKRSCHGGLECQLLNGDRWRR